MYKTLTGQYSSCVLGCDCVYWCGRISTSWPEDGGGKDLRNLVFSLITTRCHSLQDREL